MREYMAMVDKMTSSPIACNEGFVFVATRNPSYVLLAESSARSLREIIPDANITLFTNVLQIPKELSKTFTDIEIIQSKKLTNIDWANGLVDKVRAISMSKYKKTVFIDADTLVKSKEINTLFELLNEYDFLLTECAEDASRSRRFFHETLYSTGMLAYKKTDNVDKFMNDWLEITLKNVGYVNSRNYAHCQDLDHLKEEDKIFMLLTDQYSFAQLLSSNRNVFDLNIKILDERWNFRGDGMRCPPDDLVIDHQLRLKYQKPN
ncbi:MAG: hypothetical protein MRY83_03505 [Flavobacteriales bacterium]|nr:hypothetical protein [Flavobacteriales bacterium]